jgi:hypothetical protein
MSLTNELAGLTADMTAVAGLLLVNIEIGVLALRMFERPGTLRPCDFHRWCRGVLSGSRW